MDIPCSKNTISNNRTGGPMLSIRLQAIITGHLSGCGGVDRHNSLTSSSSAS